MWETSRAAARSSKKSKKKRPLPRQHLTGEEGVAHIVGRVLDSVYVIGGKYPTVKPGGRVDKTYRALRIGPRDGYHLFFHGNHRPTLPGKPGMPPSQFREHLKWMVREERLHVVRQNTVSLPMGGRRG